MNHQYAFSISVVIPVYNGAKTLAELVRRIIAVLSRTASTYEIILVNDGSRDGSWRIIRELAECYDNIIGLNLMHNYGQHNALLAGICRASHQVIVTMDDDLQHPPEELPRLFDVIDQGCDIVYGKPLSRSHPIWRNLASKFVKGAISIALGAEMAEKSSAFRAFRADLKKAFTKFTDAQVSIDVLLSWAANKIECINVEHHLRQHGKSNYNSRKLISLAMNMITGYSTLPLKIASSLGLITSVLGFCLFVYILSLHLLQDSDVSGFAFIASVIMLFSGLQLFTMGVIGEYLARVHFRTMGKPPFVVREEIASKNMLNTIRS